MTTLVPAFMMTAAFTLRVSHRVDSVSTEEGQICIRVSHTLLVLQSHFRLEDTQVSDYRSPITPEIQKQNTRLIVNANGKSLDSHFS